MRFFDQLTVNALLSRLQIAYQHSPHPIAWRNVAGAYKQFRKIKDRKIETLLTCEGWDAVCQLASHLESEAARNLLSNGGPGVEYMHLLEIGEQAAKWRHEAFEREFKRINPN
jgi:hypothetical protein